MRPQEAKQVTTRTPLLRLCAVALAMAGAPACALDLALPGPAEITATRSEPMTTFRLPIGPFAAGALPTRATEGALVQTAWRLDTPGLSTLELIAPLRDQLAKAGFTALYECETDGCGGFDFRFATDVLPEPDMHVDLGDFRYLAAERSGPAGPEFVALMVSRSSDDGFVQMTQIGKALRPAPQMTTSTKSPLPAAAPAGQSAFALPTPVPGRTVEGPDNLGKRLELGQPEVLEDLIFAPGKADLAEGDFASLAALAAWLLADPARQVTLVGHTDASGALTGNIRLSKARAESVRATLVDRFGVGAGQVQAEGVGYLAPRASNQTDDGRQKTRRVEVISTSTKLLAP